MSLATGSQYYDIHDILAGEIAVPCTLKTRVNSCARALDQSSDGTDLPAGHNLELPLWLVSDAAQRKMVSVKLPKCYGRRMREKMRAGPGCEDLKVRSPYFYTVATALHPVTDSDTLATFVNTSFRDRYQELLSKALTLDTGVEASKVQSLVCVEEACLFDAGRASVKAVEAWRYKVSSRPSKLQAGMKRRLEHSDAPGNA